jgi:hypothetical protein
MKHLHQLGSQMHAPAGSMIPNEIHKGTLQGALDVGFTPETCCEHLCLVLTSAVANAAGSSMRAAVVVVAASVCAPDPWQTMGRLVSLRPGRANV